MSDGFDSNTKAIGLYRHPNNLNSPDGSLLAADECTITRENQIDRRKGFSLCNENLPAATPQQLFVSNGTVFVNIDNKLYYDDGDCSWTLADHGSTVGAYIRNMYYDGNLIYYVEYPRVVQSTGLISTFNKTNKFISPFSGDGTYNLFSYPYPTAVNGSAYVSRYAGPYSFTVQGNYLYVADAGSSAVRRVDKTTGASTTFAGLIGTSGTLDGIGAAARFDSVHAICSDSSYLWLIDMQSAFGLHGLAAGSCNFRKINIATQQVTTVTAPAYYGDVVPPHLHFFLGYSAWTTDGHDYCYFTHLNTQTVGVSTSGDSTGFSIVRINKTTGAVDQEWSGIWNTAGYVNGTASNSRYSNLRGIWGDAAEGYIYVCDGPSNFLAPGNQVIRKISMADGSSSLYAGSPGISGYNDGIGAAASFTAPCGIWGDSTYIWVADDKTIRRIERSTVNVTTYANVSGNGSGGYVAYQIEGPT